MYGERIKVKREEYGVTRKELALMLRTIPQTIKQWEEELAEPSLTDFMALAEEFETSIDWLVGLTEFEEDHEENCEDCENFVTCKVVPHMNEYLKKNEEPAYIHIQASLNDDGDDCLVYSGGTESILSAINVMLKGMAEECGMNYYDLVALMASAQANSEMGEYLGDE